MVVSNEIRQWKISCYVFSELMLFWILMCRIIILRRFELGSNPILDN